MPVFLDLEPPDLSSDVRDVLRRAAGATSPRMRSQLVDELAARGMAVLPILGPRLASMPRPAATVAVAALDRIAARLGPTASPTDDLAVDRGEAWQAYFEAHRLDYRDTHTHRLVLRLEREDSEMARGELLRLDTFALRELMTSLDQTESRDARIRLVDVLASISGRDQRAPPHASRQVVQQVVDAWREWWFVRQSEFIVRSPDERQLAMVTETRFGKWVARLATLRLGYSLRDGRPVLDKLAERLPITVTLALLAALLSYAVAIPSGVAAAARHDRTFDRVSGIVLLALYSLPSFWVATLLLRWLCGIGGLDLFPLRGISTDGSEGWPLDERLLDWTWHLALPVFCLAYVSTASLSRYQRVAMLEVIRADYMRTARAKGLGGFGIAVRHGLRNALLPMITLLGLELPALVGGAVVIEEVFGIPGMGQETLAAARARDVPWLMAVTLLTATLTLVGMLATDVLYVMADPRIRPGRSGERR